MTVRPHGILARGFIRSLLGLYPREFRATYGAEMRSDFLETLATRPCRRAKLRFLAFAAVDAVRSAAAEHAATWGQPSLSSLPPSRSHPMNGLADDIRFGARALRRRPGFVTAVVLTLALGIGANTAVFSIIDAIFLRPVAVREPESVVAVFQAVSSKSPHGGVSYPLYRAIREQSRTVTTAATTSHQVSVKGPAGIEMLNSAVVSGNYFDMLDVHPFAGRLLADADDGAHGASPVIVLSHALWRRWFGADRDIVGHTVTIAERRYTIVGIAPPTFRGTELADVPDFWAPISMMTSLGIGGLFAPGMDAEVFRTPAFSWVEPVARLKPGVTHAAASAELNQILSRMPRDHETSSVEEPPIKTPMSVMPITQSAALRDREALVRFVRLMFGVVLLTLLLACANVANLLLVRSSERAQELGVRAALGAGRMRIVRQLFIENTMLAAGGALVGLVVALATVRALSAFTLPGSIALSQLALAVDARVLGFTATVAVATALMFGLVPAIRASRLDLATFMRNERASRPGGLLRSTLVATQAALALALLIGATLFTRSVRAGLTTDLGFDPHPLAAVTVDLRVQGYDRVRTLEYYREAIRRLRRHPEIAGVAVASHVPLARTFSLPFKAPDAITARARSSMLVPVNAVSEDYFRTLALPVLRGRAFTAADTSGGQRSIMLNEAAARVLWGTAEAIGRGLVLFGGTPYTVIGIVKTTKYESVRDEDRPVAYLPVGNDFGSGASIVVRSDSPRAALRTLQSELAAIDPTVTLRKPRLVGDQIDDVLMPQRFGSRLFAIFSLIALVIACVGVHGVVAYGVSLRQRELGIRIALGARPAHIYTVVLRDSLIAVGVGATVGLAVAIMASPALAAFLYGIKPLDTPAFIAALGALVLAAVAATSAPARRASRTDPAASIRVE